MQANPTIYDTLIYICVKINIRINDMTEQIGREGFLQVIVL